MTLRRGQFRIHCLGEIVPLDGAMGTLLQEGGLPPGAPPDALCLVNPAAVRAAHEAYVAAGARVILTNTFGATRRRLSAYRLASRAAEINRAAVAIAREAAGDRAWVAGDVGPLGEYLEPIGKLGWDEAYADFLHQARTLAAAGVDLIWVETMSDLREAKAAVMAARACFDGPVVATMTFDETGRTVTGTPPEVAAVVLAAAGADAVGANCSVGARHLVPVIKAMAAAVDLPICAQPNAGLPRLVAGKPVFRQTPAQFAAFAPKLVAAGATLVGGCCGTTPAHIAAMVAALDKQRPPHRTRLYRAALASRTLLVPVDGFAPVIVGERLNPSGRPELAARLAKGDWGAIAEDARAQVAAGAKVLDVNVGGAAGADTVMARAVTAAQLAADVPVSVDAPRADVLEAGLKAAVGKPLLNSCPTTPQAMGKLLPLARRWGAAVVGLPLDRRGVPATAAERLKLVEKFVTEALDAGIDVNDIYVDPLMLTAAQRPPAETFAALKAVKSAFGVRTILGVSNVSHGLPGRAVLNEAAFLYAAGLGLELAIVNPLDERMREAIAAASALTRGDIVSYISFFGGKTRTAKRGRETKPAAAVEPIFRAVAEGAREEAAAATAAALKRGLSPIAINDRYIAPALRDVGRRFERKDCFLPQVIRAAEAAQAAFRVMEKAWGKKKRPAAGRVLFATVAGDVHDIGKNIVAAVMRSFGFDVVDMGKNVSAARIVAAARRYDADVVALSALMTTTAPEMAKVTAALRAAGVKARPLVGGAVVTPAFARKIGAAYAPDAVGAARAARRLVSG